MKIKFEKKSFPDGRQIYIGKINNKKIFETTRKNLLDKKVDLLIELVQQQAKQIKDLQTKLEELQSAEELPVHSLEEL